MPPINNKTMLERDLSVLWHPCTQMKDHEWLPLIPIKKGDGVWLEDFEGNRYLDAISSWWVNILGHANPRINAALKNQLDTLEHVLLAGFSHEPAITLAEKLVELTPKNLTRCFFADNGSSAIEVSLKMSYHYWLNSGQPQKTKFITLANSYHGETLGALAVGDVALYKNTYKPLLMDVITVPSPDCFHKQTGESDRDYTTRMFSHMEAALEEHAHQASAVIIEPLVQCAGGMRMYDIAYLRLLRAACDKYQVHFIADEIAVGFGRTGTLFACEQAAVNPDFLCLSKALTGGYLSLASVLTTEKIYHAFYADYTSQKAFLHSHSYTGNPLACTAALTTLKILIDDNTIEKNKILSATMQKTVEELNDHPQVAEIRQKGMILAIEMIKDKNNKTPYAWQERRGLTVYQHGLKNGVLLRPLGNVVYFMPPYIISNDEIKLMAKTAIDGIHLATQN